MPASGASADHELNCLAGTDAPDIKPATSISSSGVAQIRMRPGARCGRRWLCGDLRKSRRPRGTNVDWKRSASNFSPLYPFVILPTPGCEIRNAGRFINGIDRSEKVLRLTVTFLRG